MRKVLFLDIDGVLNPKWWYRKKHVDIYGGAFDPKAVANLAQIIEKTGAEIVISSSWKELGLSKLRNMWKERKLPGKIVDVTPDYMTDEMLLNADLNDTDIDHLYIRGSEIKGWLKMHGADVSHYVIIDDMDDMDVLPCRLVHAVKERAGDVHNVAFVPFGTAVENHYFHGYLPPYCFQ